ncbi:hypothetical protein ABPG75_003268 [Micractinium tetrahymenae]
MLTPPEVYQTAVNAAVARHRAPLPRLFIMGLASGLYVGLGFSTCALVGGTLSPEFRKAQPGAFAALYSVIGLILIVFCGGDLFTGDCLYTFAAAAEGRISVLAGLRILVTSYFSNLVGCLLMVGLFDGARIWPGRDNYLTHLAVTKCSLGWGTVVVRGILGNMLVCLAVWLANSSRDATGKIVGIYLPIMSFTAIGLEHCIANMYIVPMAMIQGADVTVGRWIYRNLIPATIGNWIGGAIMVGALSAGIHGTPGAKAFAAWERGAERVQHGAAACLPGRRQSVGHVQ